MHKFVNTYAQMNSSVLEYVKIYHRNGTLSKHSSLTIFDKHLAEQTNQQYLNNTP